MPLSKCCENDKWPMPAFSAIPLEALTSPSLLLIWRGSAEEAFRPFIRTPECMPRLKVEGKFGFASATTSTYGSTN